MFFRGAAKKLPQVPETLLKKRKRRAELKAKAAQSSIRRKKVSFGVTNLIIYRWFLAAYLIKIKHSQFNLI